MPIAIHRLVNHLRGATEGERIERAIVIVIVALRIGLIAQVLIAGVSQLLSPAIPKVALVVTGAAVVFSTAFVVTALHRGDVRSRAWGVADLVGGSLALIVLSLIIPREFHVGTWIHWAPGYLDQVAAAVPAWLLSTRRSLAVGAGLGVLYLACTFPGTDRPGAVLVNALNYPMFALAAALFVAYTRRLAVEADENRRVAEESRLEALRAESALELARYSFHVHNATGLLEAFARPDVDSSLIPSLKRQALEEANRLRYEVLRPRTEPIADGPVLLEALIWETSEGFGHLPLEFSLTLGRRAPLAPEHARALKQALIALLYNVQLHARAAVVTLHADQCGDRWEVAVTDDGVGFDALPENFGFGLSQQVVASLERHGLTVSITSYPGEGTCTTISGPTEV